MAPEITDWEEVKEDDWEEVPLNEESAKEIPPKPSFLQKASPYVRPILEFGGMVGGGFAGTPLSPAGTIAGAGLGYMAGREAADVYDEMVGLKKPKDLTTEKGILSEVAESGQDFVSGAGMEAGGVAISKGIGAATRYATTKLPSRLYGSAIKAPITKKWSEVLPGKEMSKRGQAIKAGLENKIYPTEHGLAKITQLENQARTAVDDIINLGSVKGDVVKTQEIIDQGLQKAYSRAANSSDPEGAKALIDEIAEKFKAHGDTIPTKKLNDVKRQLYDEVKWGGSETTALVGQLKTMGKKGIAHEAMVSLEGFYPQIKALNKKDAAYIALKESVERAVARIGNNDMIGLGAKVLGVRSIPTAILEWTVGHPLVKSRLAFTLHSAGKRLGTVAEKELGIGVMQNSINPVYKNAKGLRTAKTTVKSKEDQIKEMVEEYGGTYGGKWPDSGMHSLREEYTGGNFTIKNPEEIPEKVLNLRRAKADADLGRNLKWSNR